MREIHSPKGTMRYISAQIFSSLSVSVPVHRSRRTDLFVCSYLFFQLLPYVRCCLSYFPVPLDKGRFRRIRYFFSNYAIIPPDTSGYFAEWFLFPISGFGSLFSREFQDHQGSGRSNKYNGHGPFDICHKLQRAHFYN